MASNSDQHPHGLLIRKLESIGPLSHHERQAIKSLPVRIHAVDAHQDIVRDGDQPRHCCLIVSGWACRYKLLREGKRQILSFHIPGDIPDLGTLHIPVMDHGLASMTKATVGFIPHESLSALIEAFPGIGALFWRATLIDAGVFRAWIVGMGRRSAFERIAHLFCEMYLKMQGAGLAGDHRCPMPVTQADLADALGLTSVHVNRVLQTMRSRALITLRSSTLVIEAWDELIRVSDFDPMYLQIDNIQGQQANVA
jgi:CRP-like cAMP-binding protein